ncbi:hypothetical protein [Streptomyces sp. AC1-42W]|uniref:hypothetical protein n=1 Tax=Streptomyces sp. AC1-42W TaxID=2218666 RepID=UPI000DAED83D|nr:hypothetical protein [Streptomyces sp. AC1-42W]PZT73032.1 hypothetical protein DNK56_34405 [Streptomyces sp. AC1-42W]
MKRARKLSCLAVAAISVIFGSVSTSHAAEQAGEVSTWYLDITDNAYHKNSSYPCTAHDWYYPSWPIDWTYNVNCGRRVWLHENVDKTGRDICIGPGQAKFTPFGYAYPAVFTVGAAKPCP